MVVDVKKKRGSKEMSQYNNDIQRDKWNKDVENVGKLKDMKQWLNAFCLSEGLYNL